jgi:hypothetical protein
VHARRLLLTAAIALTPLLACSGGGGSTASFCNAVRHGENPVLIFDRYDPTDPAAARATLQQGLDRLKQLESSAPSGEVKTSVGTLTKVAEKLIATLDQRAANPTSATTPDFRSDFDAAAQASTVVTRFAAEGCDVQLDPNAPTTVAPPANS